MLGLLRTKLAIGLERRVLRVEIKDKIIVLLKGKANEADVPEPPVEDTHVPHFMRPINASLRRIAPQCVSAQHFLQHTIEQSQQDTLSSSAPSFHFRGAHSQDTPQVAEARRRREQDRRAHRAARRAGEDVPPSQGLDTYIAQQEQENPPSTQPPPFSTPLYLLLLNNRPLPLLMQRVKFSSTRAASAHLTSEAGEGARHISEIVR
ncbi:hypothetical protein TSTA_008680 [Talaromyces stipitatus ATCC 10500]|uniref:Uncharacterized protein n=1 Tax=Talaromyces stipitatus (strain ATCC 10500 / CBS 375.48 / QM 6759 / NRRL 1006) TaxID=441959 RepID=B8MVB6_TALSN|nr:uncharacterized protein TSTA_008680 [Talaromyces stipitatus ATCC 10500]EED11572.1 hypothetical protein TSTA_008680 [Talaromyces stipitatus ATCC 10500]